MFRAAAQGDTKAARQLLELIARAESGRAAAAEDMLQVAHRYKEKWGPIFELHEREGLDPPEIYPHPDDFIIDGTTGEVTIDGPTNKEEAGVRAAGLQMAVESMARYVEVEAALAKDPTNAMLKREFKDLRGHYDILKKDSERLMRHEVLRRSRRALEAKPLKSNTPKRGPKA
jgi:rubrerythrin